MGSHEGLEDGIVSLRFARRRFSTWSFMWFRPVVRVRCGRSVRHPIIYTQPSKSFRRAGCRVSDPVRQERKCGLTAANPARHPDIQGSVAGCSGEELGDPRLSSRWGRGGGEHCRGRTAADTGSCCAQASIPPPDAADNVGAVRWYHERTKHHLYRYAQGPGDLDWANQPDPFRTFAGSPIVPLPLVADRLPTTFADLYVPRGLPAADRPGHRRGAVRAALGLSAWKEYGGYAGRCGAIRPAATSTRPRATPSCHHCPASKAGVYHYVSRDHAWNARVQP